MTVPTAIVPLADIYELRWSVLRPGLPRESAAFAEDGAPDVFHVAAYDPAPAERRARHDRTPGAPPPAGPALLGPVRACITFFPDPLPLDPDRPAYRFRGMAAESAVRGLGYGRAVLDAGIAEVRRRGVGHIWCNGRTAATDFYVRQGFTRIGEPFVLEPAGEHYVFVRAVDA